MKAWHWLTSLLVVLSSGVSGGADGIRPNIVFILADDLGYGDLGSYGQRKIRTPNLDRMAAEGMRFTAHYSGHNVCAPSRCVLMSGKHPGHGYIRENRGGLGPGGEGQEPVPAGELTLPLTLRQLGYTLGGFGKWGLGPVGSTGDPLNQGFHRFFGYNCQAVAHNYYPTHLWDNDRRLALGNEAFSAHQKLPAGADTNAPETYAKFVGKEYAPDLVGAQALRFIRENRDRPFFLYYPTTVPHLALQVPEDSLREYEGKFPETPYPGGRGYLPHRTPRAAYAAMITRLDREVGRVLDLVKQLGLDERTLFVFTSDNGPLYNRLGGTDTDFFNSAAHFRGRKGSYYEGGFRVPCIVRWTGQIKPGTTSDRVTGFEDWLPTLLELIGATDSTPAGLDGISFAPTLFSRTQEPRPFLYRESPGYGGQQCVRVGDWKAIRTNLNAGARAANRRPGAIELYDLANDPAETTDLAAAHPDVVAKLAAILHAQHTPSKLWPIRALDDGAGGDAAAQGGGGRPNFLFIYTDDQRWDALSVVQREQGGQGRFPWFTTPNLDRLAAEGTRFRNAFVVNSLCAPSRAIFLTGRYSHWNGVASNFRPFPTNNVTHATLLRAAGYTTGYVGKWHMDSQRERPGFDHHASFLGHARYRDPVFIVDGKDTEAKGWIDDLSTDYAIEFLKRQRGGATPWSMVVGFKSPHGPFEPPARARERFSGELARPVPNLTVPTPYLGGVTRRAAKAAAAPADRVPVSLDYFRCLSAVDDCVGRLLDALDELGFARNTVVIYTSDNGFYLGEHGLGDKRSAYDESLRIPFLVRYPPLAAARGRVVDEMILNLDLAPTLLDFAGVAVPPDLQGQSWRPLLTGEPVAWRESWFYEYFAEKQRNSRVPDITAVRTADAKLIRYSGHDEWTELFDLRTDPYETVNLHRDPAHAALRARLEAEHDRLATRVGYRVPDYVDRPAWWGKPGGPDWKPDPTPGLRLEFDLTRLDGNRVADASGQGNHGTVHGLGLADGRDGQQALRFQEGGYLEVPKSKSLNPAESAWTVEAVVKPERPDGVILARGGRSQGYALWLKEGRPVFTVTVGDKAVAVRANEPVRDWATLVGTITADRMATLQVNGRLVGSAQLPDLIERDPFDLMQIGADLGSPVVEPVPPKFTGLMERVRLFRGEARP